MLFTLGSERVNVLSLLVCSFSLFSFLLLFRFIIKMLLYSNMFNPYYCTLLVDVQ